MATVICSARLLADIERAFALLQSENASAAIDAVAAIRSAVDQLAAHPLLGRRIDGDIRELVISYGRTGFVALYHFAVPLDEVRVLALRRQREIGFLP